MEYRVKLYNHYPAPRYSVDDCTTGSTSIVGDAYGYGPASVGEIMAGQTEATIIAEKLQALRHQDQRWEI